ncbi:transcription initiation factor IIB [Enterocytozoon bieneusi H348]|nr:transcription initiation factor IIB [Enterocytozoon bieneusi H348]|eukprot:XP_002651926.1 transcription initiation factor IIB [Enterocytozoon bieneusi H348]
MQTHIKYNNNLNKCNECGKINSVIKNIETDLTSAENVECCFRKKPLTKVEKGPNSSEYTQGDSSRCRKGQ